MPLKKKTSDPGYEYTKTKKNIFGKTKTKEITKKKFDKTASKYFKRGGEGRGVINPMLKPGQSSIVVAEQKNRRGTKKVTKTFNS